MKTIEEKAKAYDELISKLKEWHDGLQDRSPAKDALELILTQFRESKDERIRKALVKQFGGCIKDHEFCHTGFTYAEITAWLEKQKEQKPISSCDIVPYIDDKIAALQDMWREEKVAFDWDDMHEMIEDVARHFYQKEQKPAKQKVSRAQIHHELLQNGTITMEEYLKLTENLYFPKRQKQEWSEEDEKNLELIADCVYEFYPDPVMKYKLKDWLYSLRPSWKPSEEQMEALLVAIHCTPSDENTLISLYNDLKKL